MCVCVCGNIVARSYVATPKSDIQNELFSAPPALRLSDRRPNIWFFGVLIHSAQLWNVFIVHVHAIIVIALYAIIAAIYLPFCCGFYHFRAFIVAADGMLAAIRAVAWLWFWVFS